MEREKLIKYLDILIKEGNIGKTDNSINTILEDRLSADVGKGIEFLEACEEILNLGIAIGVIHGINPNGAGYCWFGFTQIGINLNITMNAITPQPKPVVKNSVENLFHKKEQSKWSKISSNTWVQLTLTAIVAGVAVILIAKHIK